jgi:hypothetical protein
MIAAIHALRRLIAPLTSWWPPQDKLQWVTSVAVAIAASYWAALTYRLSRARGTPLLILESDGKDHVSVRNIGEGAALNTFLTDADDEVKEFVGSISGGDSRRLPHVPNFDIDHKYRLYYHEVQRGIFGRRLWTRTTLHSRSLVRGDVHREPFVTDHAHRIWLAPPTVLRRARIETLLELVRRKTRWYDPRNWSGWIKAWWMPRYRHVMRVGRRTAPIRSPYAVLGAAGQFSRG